MRRRRLERLSNLPLHSQTEPTPPETTPTKATMAAESTITSFSVPNIPHIVTEDKVSPFRCYLSNIMTFVTFNFDLCNL